MDDFSNPEIADSLEKAFRHLGGHAEGEELLGESLRAAKAAEKEEAVRQRGASSSVVVVVVVVRRPGPLKGAKQ